MSNMKRWLRENGISYRQLAGVLNQTGASISQKVNRTIRWQYDDMVTLRNEYGLSSDFVQDMVSYDDYFASDSKREAVMA